MADHDKPGITDTYVNVLADLDARLEDQAKGFDPATTTPTNLKTGTVRWTSASKKWQQWNGSAWVDLVAEYAINISGTAAKLKTERNFSLTGGATAAAVGFDGSGNVALNVTALDGTKVSAATTSAKGAVTLADSTAIASGTPGRIVDAAQLKVVKDSIPAAQVQSDWNASSGVAAIMNKPTLGTASGYNVGTEPNEIPTNAAVVPYDPTPSVTGTASFTLSTNQIVLTGIVSAIGLEVGDVIKVTGTVSNNNIYTVETISDADTIRVNYEHRNNRGPLTLTNESNKAGTTIQRLAKWYVAPTGLGQAWVDVKSSRSLGSAYTNNTGRPIMVAIRSGGSSDNTVLASNLTIGTFAQGGVDHNNSFLVPAGENYKTSNGNGTLRNWIELR